MGWEVTLIGASNSLMNAITGNLTLPVGIELRVVGVPLGRLKKRSTTPVDYL